jgi:hypothetical protein
VSLMYFILAFLSAMLILWELRRIRIRWWVIVLSFMTLFVALCLGAPDYEQPSRSSSTQESTQ